MNILSAKQDLNFCIPLLCKYIHINKHKLNINKLAAGELYTLLRRHSNHTLFSNPRVNIAASNFNVDINDGIIHNIELIKSYGGSYINEKIDLYNKCIQELNFNYSELAYKAGISAIINNVENYNLNLNKDE